jgi:hypothetical protein
MIEKLIANLNELNYTETYQLTNLKIFSNAFNSYLETIKEVKYLILGENPVSWKTYVYNTDGTGGFINLINNAFGLNDESINRLECWANKGILFLDIYQLFDLKNDQGFDLNKKKKNTSFRETLMKSIINHENEKLNYPIFRIKIAITHLQEKLKSKNIIVSNDVKVALMIPQLTSLPIFNYFSNRDNKICLNDIELSNSFRELNSQPSYENIGEYIIIPRHKANTIGGSNNPKSELIKLALDL